MYAPLNCLVIGLDNGLSLDTRQAIISTIGDFLSITPKGADFNKRNSSTNRLSLTKLHLNMSSVIFPPVYPGEWGNNEEADIKPLQVIGTSRDSIRSSVWCCSCSRTRQRLHTVTPMMTSSNGNIFRVTGHLCGKFTGYRWNPRTKANNAELWCFLWFVPE